MHERKSKFNNTTRWLADSAFTTYFGKPAFHSYGRANVKPAIGGVRYGQSMLTHNINPESGDNNPLYQQVYDTALEKGKTKTQGLRVPAIPKVEVEGPVTAKVVRDLKKRNPTMPKQNHTTKKVPLAIKESQYVKEGDERGLKRTMHVKSATGIQIAKPEMTLTGFRHDPKTLRKKTRLQNRANREANDIYSKSGGRSASNRRSSNRAASMDRAGPGADIFDDDEDIDSQQELDSGIEDIPKNQEIESVNSQKENEMQIPLTEEPDVYQKLPSNAPTEALNPKNYAFVPAQWLNKIPAAGSQTVRSESFGMILHQPLVERRQEVV